MNLIKVSLSEMFNDVLSEPMTKFNGKWDDSQLDELEELEHQHDAEFYNGYYVKTLFLFILCSALKDMFKKEHLDRY